MLPENNDASTTRARSSSGQHNDMIQEGGNYGNETAATIQKAADHQISELTVDEISKAKVEHDIQVLAEISEEVYMSGWRLHFLTAGVWLALFLSTLETTIVSTSLVSIADAVGGFEMRDWVVTSYLITYTSYLIIYAKFSDVFGRKTMMLVGLGIFTVFSILCGTAKSITSLIIFRAFQGMGASGIYSLTMVLAPTLVPPAKFGAYMAVIATVFLLASVLGPVLGGVINENGGQNWRWIFLLNVPGGVIAFLLLVFFLPSSKPPNIEALAHIQQKFRKDALSRVDMFGTFLLLSFSILLVFALEEAGSRFPWSSPTIIITMSLAIISGVGFVVWELWLEHLDDKQEPTFPLSLLRGRVLTGMMLSAFLIGFPFVVIVVSIPQRAQAVYGLSPSAAGLSLLPLLLTSPLATALSGYLTSNRKVPPVYLIIGGAVFQVLGVGSMCQIGVDETAMPKRQYGYEVLMGLGFGMGLSTILVLARLVVDEKDLPVTMGALTQVRVLGGTISLAICSTILNNRLSSSLSGVISVSDTKAISENLSAIHTLTIEQQVLVRKGFAKGYQFQNWFLIVMTSLGFCCCILMWEKVARRLH